MIKRICDICGADADMEFPLNVECTDKLLTDDTARVKLTVHAGMVKHSKNNAGRPDICVSCFQNMVSSSFLTKVNSL